MSAANDIVSNVAKESDSTKNFGGNIAAGRNLPTMEANPDSGVAEWQSFDVPFHHACPRVSVTDSNQTDLSSNRSFGEEQDFAFDFRRASDVVSDSLHQKMAAQFNMGINEGARPAAPGQHGSTMIGPGFMVNGNEGGDLGGSFFSGLVSGGGYGFGEYGSSNVLGAGSKGTRYPDPVADGRARAKTYHSESRAQVLKHDYFVDDYTLTEETPSYEDQSEVSHSNEPMTSRAQVAVGTLPGLTRSCSDQNGLKEASNSDAARAVRASSVGHGVQPSAADLPHAARVVLDAVSPFLETSETASTRSPAPGSSPPNSGGLSYQNSLPDGAGGELHDGFSRMQGPGGALFGAGGNFVDATWKPHHSGQGQFRYPIPNGLRQGVSHGDRRAYGDHPSRTLYVQGVVPSIADSDLRALFGQFGEIRTMYMGDRDQGFIMVSYFDVRHSKAAIRNLNSKVVCGMVLNIHYSIPRTDREDSDIHNQGTLVVFNLDPRTGTEELRNLFGRYGEIKEIRETPRKRHHKFVEFFDTRDAEAAMQGLNKRELRGKTMKIEASRPGGARRNMVHMLPGGVEGSKMYQSYRSAGGVGPGYNGYPSQMYHGNNPGQLPIQPSIGPDVNGYGIVHQHSAMDLNEHRKYDLKTMEKSRSEGNLSGWSPADERCAVGLDVNVLAAESKVEQMQESYPNAVPRVSEVDCAEKSPVEGDVSSGAGDVAQSLEPGKKMLDDTRMNGSITGTYSSLFMQGSSTENLEVKAMSKASVNDNGDGSSLFIEAPKGIQEGSDFAENDGVTRQDDHATEGQGNVDTGSVVRSDQKGASRHRRQPSDMDKERFKLSIEDVITGDDRRTTLMIRNIPNKYTQKMLLSEIDLCCEAQYDFFYLPIDFKNRCNYGYAFINFIEVANIVAFYHSFNKKKWDKFNSEKICSITYARIQGRHNLLTHFQNSSVLAEDRKYRPIILGDRGGQQQTNGMNSRVWVGGPPPASTGNDAQRPPRRDKRSKLRPS